MRGMQMAFFSYVCAPRDAPWQLGQAGSCPSLVIDFSFGTDSLNGYWEGA